MKKYKEPVIRLLTLLVVTIFIAELGIMLSINYLFPPMSNLMESFFDSLILIIILFPVLYVLVFRKLIYEIGERVNTEKKLFKHQKQLEELVKDRTNELEHSNKLKDLFIDIISHDMINPLTCIINFADLVEEEKSLGDIKHINKRIKKNGYNLYEMIDSASQLAKLETEGELDTKSKDLSSIVTEAKDTFESYAEEKNIEVVNKINGKYPAQVNPSIFDVFTNLVSNAIKYSPKKSKVSLDILDDNDGWIVKVKDNGKGVPDKYKETIFSRFERLEKRGVEGSGLGLAIAKKIVDLHNGKIWVEDNPEGGGSIFNVRLPKKRSEK